MFIFLNFKSLNIKRHKWEEQFNVHQLSWKIFLQKTKLLEEWISNAQLIVSEKNDDYTYLIHKHKVIQNIFMYCSNFKLIEFCLDIF